MNFEVSDQAADPGAYRVQMWDYLWSKRYGSDQFSVLRPGTEGRDELTIQRAVVSPDHRSITLQVPDLQVCDQVRIVMIIQDANGLPFEEEVHMTINAMAEGLENKEP